MKKATAPLQSVEDYISAQPAPAQVALQKMRKAIAAAAPGSTESISYGIPTVKMMGSVVVHYGAFEKHIGLYATPTGHVAFADRLKEYKQGKGSVQFPLSQPLPLELIKELAAFRWKQAAEDATRKEQIKATAKPAMRKTATSGKTVTDYMSALTPAGRQALNVVRKIIMRAHGELEERIKWDAPSYYYKGTDILTFGPYKEKDILLVVHHPAVVSVASRLLSGTYKDRRLVRFKDKHEASAAGEELQRIIRDIIHSIDSINNKNKSHAKTTF